MKPTRTLFTAAAVTVALTLAACDEGSQTEPTVAETLDTEAALADYDALASAFASEEWAGFQALDGRTPFAGSAAAFEAVSALSSASDEEGGRAFATRLARALTAERAGVGPDGPLRGPIISGWHRGTTFVYDPATDEYTPDLAREGAPATGVRFILYGTDASGIPQLEEERGYADLIDEGDASAEDLALRLLVVYDERTVLDYRTTLDHGLNRGALTVAGFFAGPNVQLDFDLAVSATGPEDNATLDIDFDLDVVARGFSIDGSIRGLREGAEDESGAIQIEVRHRTDTLRIDLDGQNGILDGSIELNGQLFATVSGPDDDPTFLSADGDALTPREVLVLFRVVDVIEDVFDLLEDLVDPVDELVLLGFIL